MPKRCFIIFTFLVTLTALPAWGLDLKPGKYEITSKVEMPGMPGGMPPQTVTQCLTEQDPVPTGAQTHGCSITDIKTQGNKVTYTITCNQQGMQTKSSGEMTYNGDTFEGTTLTDMGPSGGGMKITTKVSGKRIGNCD